MNILNIIKMGQENCNLDLIVKDTRKHRRILCLLASKRIIRGYFKSSDNELKVLLKCGAKRDLKPVMVSKSSKRIYCSSSKSTSFHIISSSKGISYGYHTAGGEVLFLLP